MQSNLYVFADVLFPFPNSDLKNAPAEIEVNACRIGLNFITRSYFGDTSQFFSGKEQNLQQKKLQRW